MEAIDSIRPIVAVLIPLAAAGLILMLRRNPNRRDVVSVVAAVILFLIVLSMAPVVLEGGTYQLTLFTVMPGIDFAFRVDALGLVFATISSTLWIAAAFYSIGYMRSLGEHAQTRFFVCFAASIGAAIGGAFSANLFTLVIFYEALSLVTYPLVYHHEDDEAWEGSKKYIVYLVGTSKTFLLAAIALTFMLAGNLDFAPQGLLAEVNSSPLVLTAVYLCFLAGFAKAGIMPLHIWLPSAMVAPTPVSALLHAVAVVKMGVFCVLRVIFHVFGIELMSSLGLGIITAYLVSFTIIMSSVYALTRDDLKARLAYSTVSQLSYIILGAALLAPSAMVGGIVHLASHAFSKITLFFCAGSIYCAARRKKISTLSGIGRRMPWTMAAFFIGSLSMIGIPPAAGFTSKWMMIIGSVEADRMFFLGVFLVSSILNAAYFLPISYKAFFEDEKEGQGEIPDDEIREIPMIVIPLFVTAILSLILGIYPDYFVTLAREVVG